MSHLSVPFFLPEHAYGDSWKIIVDTSEKISQLVWKMKTELPLKERSVVLLELNNARHVKIRQPDKAKPERRLRPGHGQNTR